MSITGFMRVVNDGGGPDYSCLRETASVSAGRSLSNTAPRTAQISSLLLKGFINHLSWFLPGRRWSVECVVHSHRSTRPCFLPHMREKALTLWASLVPVIARPVLVVSDLIICIRRSRHM